MPKHVPTFKHLISSSYSQRRQDAKRERSVNDLLASSRSSRHSHPLGGGDGGRETPPHLAQGERAWVPAPGSGMSSVGGLVDVDDSVVHLAEHLRRSYVSQRQASRAVAGPAPPPSWRAPASTAPPQPATLLARGIRPATTSDLRRASELLSHPSLQPPSSGAAVGRGTSRLVEYGLLAVLRHLEAETFVYFDREGWSEVDGSDAPLTNSAASGSTTLGALLREQVAYLEPHLKSSLIELAALRPEGSATRLTDRGLRAILTSPPDPDDHEEEVVPRTRTSNVDIEHDDWDDFQSQSMTLHHLPLTLHLNPASFLRSLPSLPVLSLTSLNLAYCTIPNMERLVAVLPPALRELGLAGVRPLSESQETALVDDWRRALAALGRRMIVLRMLDLSFPSVKVTPLLLSGLLHPPSSRLPSLRLLGLRGLDLPRGQELHATSMGENCVMPVERKSDAESKKVLTEVVRSQGRRYVEIVWH